MISFFKYSMNEEMQNAEPIKIGDICIFLKNGNLQDEIMDYGDVIPRPVKTKMAKEYFDKKCEVIDMNTKIWDLHPTYKIKFLHNKRVTFCKKDQIKIDDENRPRTDTEIKNRALEETKNGKMLWKHINAKNYKSEIMIKGSASKLRFDLECIGLEWVLKIYFHKGKEVIGTLVKRINGVSALVNKVMDNHFDSLKKDKDT